MALALATAFVLEAASAVADVKVDDRVLHTTLDESGVVAERTRIINFIWGSAGLPLSKQPSLHKFVASPVANLTNVQSVDALRITMENQEYTLAYHFVPLSGKKNRLVIVHQGHACLLDDGPGSGQGDGGIQRTIKALIANGYGVLAINMPRLSPPNAAIPDPGNCGDHSLLFQQTLTAGNALKFFIEPVVVSINYLSQTSPVRYTDFNMVGLSGGGWTTTLAAAIDTRIKLSFPVAGTLPMYLRAEPYNHDIEQFLPAFYGSKSPVVAGVAGYLDLYLLAARGAGRSQVQILNRNDNCCFGPNQHNAGVVGAAFEPSVRTYETRLKTMVATAPGFFRAVIDDVSPFHMISDNAINNVILPSLAGNAQTLSTTINSTRNSALCLDIPNFGRPPQNGDYVQLYACGAGSNQQWSFQSDGSIRSTWNTALCLDVPDFGRPPQNGDQLQIFSCNGGVNQKFDLRADGTLRSRTNGICVDVPDLGRPPQNGDRLQVYSCNGGTNQSFSANKLTTAISSVWAPHLCIDLPDFGRAPQNGDYLQVYQCNGPANQRFNSFSDGTIRTESGALCVDLPALGRPPQNGDQLQVFACNGGLNQQFDLQANGSLKSRAAGGLCVDIPNFGRPPQNGDRLQVFGCQGSSNQKFYVKK